MKQNELKSEITGSVWKILKKVGDRVDPGDVLMIFESMKMEIPLESESAGTIAEVRVTEGASVAEGDVVVILAQ